MLTSSQGSSNRMIRYVLAFLLSVGPVAALAQDVEQQPSGITGAAQSSDHDADLSATSLADIPTIDSDRIAKRPSLAPVFKAIASSNVSEAHAEILVEYDMQGDVTDARFLKGAGNGSINNSILEWAKQVKFVPGEAGKGRLSFDMKTR
jgi:outer membrane biosynthesis protein TonB